MEDPPGNSPSNYPHLFSRGPSHLGNMEVLSSISFIWEDDCIEKLENNQMITDDVRTPSATLSARVPQEQGACCDLQTCTPHDTPVLYAPAGRKVCAGQRMSVPGRYSSLYK